VFLKDVYQLSKWVWFMREGSAYTRPHAGTVARDSKPDGDDPAYIQIGLIEGFEHDFSGGEEDEVWRPGPGRLGLYDGREIKPRLTLRWTSGELSPLALEVFYRTRQQLTEASAQFGPGSSTLRNGWLHAQCYDGDTDDLRMTFALYGRLKVTGGMASEETDIVKPEWEFLSLYSRLATVFLPDEPDEEHGVILDTEGEGILGADGEAIFDAGN